MDKFDIDILSCLKTDGRMSLADISEQASLSISSVARRIRTMENDGIIEGYSVQINEEKIGFGFPVFVSVRLERQLAVNFSDFEKKIRTFPEVVECWLMTGNQDYLIKLSTANLREFETFLTENLTAIKTVSSVETSIPLRCVKPNEVRCR